MGGEAHYRLTSSAVAHDLGGGFSCLKSNSKPRLPNSLLIQLNRPLADVTDAGLLSSLARISAGFPIFCGGLLRLWATSSFFEVDRLGFRG